MKKNISLKNSLIMFLLAIAFSGCFEEDCLDIEELDQRTEEIKMWYAPDSIIYKTLVDPYGMSQTLTMSAWNTHHWDDIVEDDCGNTYGSTYFSVQYNTSLSPLHFMVDIQGSGNDADGFYLKLRVTNTNSHNHKSSTYDFVTKKCREKNARVDILKQTDIGGTIYDTILKIEFDKTFSANDVKSVYYAKGTGIVKYQLENGNGFWVEEEGV
ncbi:MAG: hypothetical protein ACOC2E_07180 [Bacteroidota bacterium]